MISLLLAVIYLSFIGLGLPDALLGAAWPVMHVEFGVPVSCAGVVSVIITVGTIISSLLSDRLTYRLGAGKVTAVSVAMTAVALLGFSCSTSYGMLCLWAVPYGLGAGGVDAALNNYVALHYASRHMSWLHCMWGIGATVGPYVMGYALSGGQNWNMGYRYIAWIQMALTLVLLLSLPLWKIRAAENGGKQGRTLSLREIFAISGVRETVVTFFSYCALETTAGLWASSYLVLYHGVQEERAAAFAGLFYLGITLGRAVSGFLTMKFSDAQMIRLGCAVIGAGLAAMLLPVGAYGALVGLILVGLGCAPIYPCIIHSTPEHFGVERSQAVIGVQMASAYTGSCVMSPLFGLIANHIGVELYPVCLLLVLAVMAVMHEKLLKICG